MRLSIYFLMMMSLSLPFEVALSDTSKCLLLGSSDNNPQMYDVFCHGVRGQVATETLVSSLSIAVKRRGVQALEAEKSVKVENLKLSDLSNEASLYSNSAIIQALGLKAGDKISVNLSQIDLPSSSKMMIKKADGTYLEAPISAVGKASQKIAEDLKNTVCSQEEGDAYEEFSYEESCGKTSFCFTMVGCKQNVDGKVNHYRTRAFCQKVNDKCPEADACAKDEAVTSTWVKVQVDAGSTSEETGTETKGK